MQSQIEHLMLVTVEDPFDSKSWSGTPFFLRLALERHVNRLTVIRPERPSRKILDVAKRVWYGGKSQPRYPLWMTSSTLNNNARQVRAEIERARPDAVLSISSQCIAELGPVKCPVVMFSDAPWVVWLNEYEATMTRPVRWKEYAQREANATKHIDGICFGSEWAVQEALRVYGGGEALRRKLSVTPLGANWVPELSSGDVIVKAKQRVPRLSEGKIQLLFVGKDWIRKGGPLAVEIARLLSACDREVHLHIVGCRPDLPLGVSDMCTIHGLLLQSDAHQRRVLNDLFLFSHFLIVPSTAECFGIVYAEAQAFGLPPIARAVQALPTVVQNGITGILLDVDATAETYVQKILALVESPDMYISMATRARQYYEDKLNWDQTALGILEAACKLQAST